MWHLQSELMVCETQVPNINYPWCSRSWLGHVSTLSSLAVVQARTMRKHHHQHQHHQQQQQQHQHQHQPSKQTPLIPILPPCLFLCQTRALAIGLWQLKVTVLATCRVNRWEWWNPKHWFTPSKIEWDLTNGPLSRLLELLDTQVEGSIQVGPAGDFLIFLDGSQWIPWPPTTIRSMGRLLICPHEWLILMVFM